MNAVVNLKQMHRAVRTGGWVNDPYNNSLLPDDNKRLGGRQICHRYYTAKTNLVTVCLSINQ